MLPTFYSDLLLMETRWIVGQAGAAAYVCYVPAGWSWFWGAFGLLRRVMRPDETRDIAGSAAGLLPVIGILLQLNENCETHAEHIISPQASFPLQSVHNFPIRAT